MDDASTQESSNRVSLFTSGNALLVIAMVALGGALGAVARLLVAEFSSGLHSSAWPLGTFIANILGAFLIGIAVAYFVRHDVEQYSALRALLAVGFLGSFTTFSTFKMEAHTLFEDGNWFVGSAYIGVSVFVGLLAVRLGTVIGRALFG